MPSASSEEDIDPELREGINNIMKLRDEYDKLEGTLRKLGVESRETDDEAYEDDEEDNLYEEEEEDDLLIEHIEKSSGESGGPPPGGPRSSSIYGSSSANNNTSSDYYSCEDDLTPPIQRSTNTGNNSNSSNILARLGQLDILEEVDESLLSSDTGGEDPPLPPPPSYPWVQMALPGGGIVSVPLQDNSRLDSPGGGDPSVTSASAPTSGGSGGLPASDVLTVNAGEPVTHFNLDQLLEIVQSFQLDATMAGHEEGGSSRDLQALVEPSLLGNAGDLPSKGCDVLTSGTTTNLTSCDNRISRTATNSSVEGGVGGGEKTLGETSNLREIHSCPSSPTETDCSSGFSTLRRRSVTLTEKIRTNRDGSKTQVLRQYGCNTSSVAEATQSVSYQQNSFVYINGSDGKRTGVDTSTTGSKSSRSFPSLIPITSSAAPSMSNVSVLPSSATTLPRSTQPSASSTGASCNSQYRGHIVRLNSIEPNTVMFSTKDYPLLYDISVPEIIDELEKQFDDKLCDLQGVRLVGSNVYICLGKKDSLNTLSTYGFYVRGISVKLVDITHDSVVICLTGVPHYITDSTITMLVSTFGICIGEVERRFYKGVDTGERYIRLKPRSHTQIPDFVTVGGCKILIRILNQDEVCLPFTLSEFKSADSGDKKQQGQGNKPSGISNNFRAKPGHCNGSVNSPNGEMPSSSSSNVQPFFSSTNPFSSPPRTNDFLVGEPPPSPKIGKSFRSRISLAMRSPTDALRTESGAYISGELIDLPALSPPPYKPPSTNCDSASSSSTVTTSGKEGNNYMMNGGGRSSSILGAKGSSDDLLYEGPPSLHHQFSSHHHILRPKPLISSSTASPTNNISSTLRKIACKGLPKTDSSNSLNSQKNNNPDKRSSVNFEEPRRMGIGANNSNPNNNTTHVNNSNSNHHNPNNLPTSPPTRSNVTSCSKTVNGILRKGSGPGDEIVSPISRSKMENLHNNNNNNNNNVKEDHPRRHRKSKNDRSSTAATKSSRSRNSKLESVTESGGEDGGENNSTLTRSSRSRSNSTKSNKGSSSEKTQKDLALTRDLPWCGCWGNGCL
nr:uncharacterized protein LOC121120399 isoform X1 [Lepeophtheirus salmonis]